MGKKIALGQQFLYFFTGVVSPFWIGIWNGYSRTLQKQSCNLAVIILTAIKDALNSQETVKLALTC